VPKTAKGRKVYASMKKTYGPKKAKKVFHASANKGTIRGVHRKKER
jgi:hypothetical protein